MKRNPYEVIEASVLPRLRSLKAKLNATKDDDGLRKVTDAERHLKHFMARDRLTKQVASGQ